MSVPPGAAAEESIVQEIRLIARQGRKVWRLVPRRHKVAFAAAAGIMALTSAANTAVPLLLGSLVDRVKVGTENNHPPATLLRTAVIFLGIIAAAYLVREALQVVRRYMVENSCTRMERVMTVKLVSHLMRVDLSSLSQEKIGALQGRISRSVVGFVRYLRLGFLDLLPPLLTGLFALTAALTKQPSLALVMVGVMPASIFLTVRQIMSQKGVRLKLIRSREEMDGTVVELLGGMDYVRAANTSEFELNRVARAAEYRRKVEIRHHFQMSLFGCAKALNEGLFHVIVLALAIYLAVHGRTSFGDILTFSILFMNVMSPLAELHRGLDEGHECSLQVNDLLDMLAEPVDRSFAPAPTHEPALRPGEPVIEVEDLTVDYVTRDGTTRHALEGLTTAIRHGETIGVAGKSGCGKSTWLRVLLRLTHPTRGRVRVGGVPIEELSRESIGRLIGYVSQYPFVFQGTVAENIGYGAPGASPEAIRRAAEAAYIHEEIMAMPGGYQAPIAERGQNLSGGQRQRLALARIFLKNPPILILDEATSALDNISERWVQQAIDAARADRTVILVAHRLSTLRDADRILVFDDGRVVEEGPYAAILAHNGVFAELVRCAELDAPITPAVPEEQPAEGAVTGNGVPEVAAVPA